MSMFQTAAEILMGAQTEIAIFIIAICAHSLIFGKYRFMPASLKSKGSRITSRSPKAASFARSVQQLMHQGADQKTLAKELDQHLQSCPRKGMIEVLVGVLEYTGNATTAELLTAIRLTLQKYNLRPQGQLVSLMSRSYLTLHLQDEFDKLLAEVEDMENVPICATMFYLRAAIKSSDFKVAMIRIRKCAPQFRSSNAQTPSVAFKGLMQQLICLACEQAQVPVFLQELHDDGLFTSWVLEYLLTECAQRNAVTAMQKVEEFAHTHNVEFTATAYCMLVRGACEDHEVLDIYDKHLIGIDVCVDPPAGCRILEAAFHCHRPEIVQQVLTLSKETPKQVAVLKSFATQGHKDEVKAIFRACPQKNTCLYNAFLGACIDFQDMQAAKHIMSEAVNVGVADVMTYSSMIKAYLLVHDTKRAHATLDAMRVAGFAPSSVTFNELINATISTSMEDVWALIGEMEACGLKPNRITCSILLKSIQQNSTLVNVERTLNLLSSIGEEMDEVLLGSACEACIRVGRADLLMQQLEWHQTRKLIQVKGSHTFGSIIRAYGYVKDINGAWKIWNEMRAQHLVPTSITIGCMVEALVLNGEIQVAYDLIHELLDNEQTRPLVNAVIYGSILKGFSHQKRFASVWAVYEEMRLERIQFSIVTYNALIDACARSGDMVRVPALLDEMCSQKIAPNTVTYSTILKGYCNERSIDKALELLEDMKKTSEFRPDEITYNTLLDGCARMGLYDRGVALLRDMEEQGVQPSNFTLSVLAKLASRSRLPDKAFELCEQISQKYHICLNVHVFNNLVQACTTSGNIHRAFKVFEQMLHEKVRPDARTYTLLLRGCISMNQARDAAGLLRAAMGLRGAHPKFHAFGTNSLQLRGGLPTGIITEILESISNHCNESWLAVELAKELRTLSSVSLDPKLALKLTSKATAQP